MQHKNLKVISLIAVTSIFMVLCAMAQSDKSEGASKGSSAKHKTITGCLQKGDEPNEYSISDNGKTYGLRSTKIDLSKHVGHTVSVTGTLRPESAEHEMGEKNEKNEKNEVSEAGDIRVTDLKMIKEGCK